MTTQLDDILKLAARAAAKADGLDWDEVCGLEADRDECDSGTCVAALCEDHDIDWARAHYLRHARAALAAAIGPLGEMMAGVAETTRTKEAHGKLCSCVTCELNDTEDSIRTLAAGIEKELSDAACD